MKNTMHSIYCLRRGYVFFFLLLFLLHSTSVLAQNNRKVSGTVTDENDEPVIGATVVVPNQRKYAAITNVDGFFELMVPISAKELEISFLGYEKVYLKLKTQATYKVQLTESAYQLDEVVAIGYGSTKRGNVTGSISKITADDLARGNGTNVASSLYGALAGVEINTASGALGEEVELLVRGAASINADATPLYVVDGVPADGLSSLNPSDIESIEVLKDASSAAIYGSRGSNGVILITTKTAPETGKVEVAFSVDFSMQQLERKVDILSPEEWIQFRTNYNNIKYLNSRSEQGATIDDDWDTRLKLLGKVDYQKMNDPRWTQPNYGGLKLIDWQDEFFRWAPMQNYQLSIANGNKTSRYRISLGYVDQEGIAIETDYQRLSFRVNAETKFLNRITIGTNLSQVMTWNNGGQLDGKGNRAQGVLTTCPVAEPDAGVMTGAEPYDEYAWASDGASAIAYMKQMSNHKETARLNTTAYIKIDIIKGLRADITGSYNFTSSQTRNFIPSSVQKGWEKGEGYNTTARRQDKRSNKFLFQGVLNYNRDFGKHNIGLMGGYSMEGSTGADSQMDAKQFPDNSLESFDMKDISLTRAYATITTPVRMISYFGRLQYEYDNRYLLTGSIRRDGSTRFGRDNLWGIFPAVSAAYRISNEKFWPKSFVMNSMKVRASWGITGNNSITNNAAIGKVESANYSFDGTLVNGFAPTSLENNMLGWEKTHSWNLGFDMGFFRNRILLSFDLYDKTTESLLYQVSVPALMGFSKAWGNIGNLNNRGFELELTTQNLTGPLKWTTSFNAFYNKNKVVSLGEDNSIVYTGYGNTQMYKVGEPLRVYYMYDAVGVYQYKEDLVKYPTMANSELGDVRYRDANGDGVINENDRTIIGKPTPDWTFGLRNVFRYKNFDLSIMLTAQTGGMIYGVLGRAMDKPGMSPSINMLSCWKNMWMSEEQPGDGKTPWLDSNTGALYDSRWLYSTDYLKIKNITLGYEFPIRKGSKILKKARVYLSGDNLWMLDSYKGGFSPEAKNGGKNGDYDYGSYPLARILSVGASVTF